MKKIFAGVVALGMTAGCSGVDLTEEETRLGGLVAGGVVGNAINNSPEATAAGAILGYALGGAVSRAQAAGCRYTSVPAGQLVFRSRQDGIYLSCPSPRPGNDFIEGLRADPNWQLVTYNSQPRRTTNRRGAPALRGFNY